MYVSMYTTYSSNVGLYLDACVYICMYVSMYTTYSCNVGLYFSLKGSWIGHPHSLTLYVTLCNKKKSF